MTQLSHRQLQVFDFVARFQKEHEVSPTLDQICQGVGLNQPIEASRYISILVEKKYLFRLPGARQQIRIVKYPEGASDASDKERAAYARGVKAGRAQLLSGGAPDAHALKQAYERGRHDGRKEAHAKLPKDVAEAFERGISFGRKELKEELTYDEKLGKEPESVPADASSSLVLPFLRRSD